MHDRHAGRTRRVRLDVRYGPQRVHGDAELLRRPVEIGLRDAANDERPARELLPASLERLLGALEIRLRQAIAQRHDRVVRVMVDREHRTGAHNAALGANLAGHALHRRVQNLRIGHTDGLRVEPFRERPARVVVRVLLRVVRAPVLVVEQRVRDARVRLVHSDDVRAGRERSRRGRRASACGIRCGTRRGAVGPGSPRRRTCRGARGNRHRERRCRTRDLDGLLLHDAQELRLCAGTPIVGREHVRGRALGARLRHRPLALLIEVLEELPPVVREIAQRDEQPCLLVVVVVPERPPDLGQRRILSIPRPRRLLRGQGSLHRLGRTAVAERLVEAADAVVRRRDEHQVPRRPRVERAVREHAGHAEPRHLLHVVPADQLPLVGQQRVDPRVVRAVADRVVVEVRHRLMQVVQHLRLPVDVGVEDILRQLERHPHRVAVVVVRDVLAPVEEWRRGLARPLHAPVEEIHDAVASVDLDDGGDERDEVVADVPDVLALVDGEAVGELHQRRRRACFRGVDRPGDVVHRRRVGRDLLGHLVIHVDRAWIRELRELGLVLVEPRQQRLGGDGDGDHLAPLFRLADRVDLHARARLLEHAHVVVDLLRVRQLGRRAGNVA